jgi:DNA polymerase-3 subunit gamma/tau
MMTETRIETYIPLYRKYRPQAFADMVGQEAIVQTLGNAIQLSKVAHAYLFCGPRGTGKTSTARIFAKSLNCEQGPTVAPCQQCASCIGIVRGNALDVVEFDAASNNGVADARELIENCQYSSMTGRFKVYIIDEVHMLTTAAFNALLKTLEEPPANVIFIFATTEAHKVLPTIISRCQRFDFNRITTENIISRLQFIAERENIAINAEALLTIARHARGGLRDAVGLLDQVAVLGRAQQDKVISRKDVALFIGALEEDLLLLLGNAIAERRAADLLSELSELLNRGIEPIQLLKDLTTHFRNLLIVSTAGPNINPETLSLPPDYFQQLTIQAALFPEPEEVPQIIGRLAFVERNIRNSNQPQLWLEVGLIELAYRHEINLVKDLSERVARLESQLAGQAPLPLAQALPPVAPAPRGPMPSAPVRQAQPAAPQAKAQPQPQPVAAPAFSPPEPSVAPPAAIRTAQPEAAASPAPRNQSPLTASSQPVTVGQVLASAVSPAAEGSLEGQYQQACTLIPSLPFRSLLQQQTFPLTLSDDLLTLGCMSEAHQITLKKPEKLIHLQRAVDKAFGRPIRIEVVLEKKRPAGSTPPVTAQPPVAAAQPKPAPVAPLQAALTAPPALAQVVQPASDSATSSVLEEVSANEPQPSAVVAVMEPPAAPSQAPPQASTVSPQRAASLAGPPSVDEMPPMDVDDPPMMDDDEGSLMASMDEQAMSGRASDAASAQAAQVAMASLGGDHDLSEAKKHAVEVLQGRLIE